MVMKVKLFAIALLSVGLTYAQSVEVVNKKKLPITDAAFSPILDSKGEKVLFTTENYKGLKLYDLTENKQVEVSTDNGAGYKPVFGAGGNEVYYRKTSYQNGFRQDALLKTNLKKMTKQEIIASSRSLKSPVAVKDGITVASEGKLLKTGKAQQPYAVIEDNKIALYQGNDKTILQPCGADVIGYVWPSVSPDGTKLLFTCAGKGTFISDLKGKLISDLGTINAPVWYTNNFVVGMVDSSDGQDYTASKIVISSVDGQTKQDLTDAQEIAMFPSVSPESNSIAYNTLNGEIFILSINIKK